jgi:hypothetical protein
MAATSQDIMGWLIRGKTNGADFVIVVCDTYDHEDYPVFCTEAEFKQKHAQYNGKNMQIIMEVYDLSLDITSQMQERRAFHYPASFRECGTSM